MYKISKKLFLLIFTIFLFFVCFKNFSIVEAAGPTISIDPLSPTTIYTNGIRVKITGLILTKKYNLNMKINGGPSPNGYGIAKGGNQSFPPNNDAEWDTDPICPTGYGGYNFQDSCNQNFPEGQYELFLREEFNNDVKASFSFSVITLTASALQCTNPNFTTSDDIKISIDGLPDHSYKILVDGKDPNGGGNCHNPSGGKFEYNIGSYYEGFHYIQVFKNNSLNPLGGCDRGDLIALATLTISNDSNHPGSCISTPANSPIDAAQPIPCTSATCASGGGISCGDVNDPRGSAFSTAIGCVHTNPTELVKDLMKFAVGIGGGLAFLMMLLGAFQMLTSAGNPETLNAGKERLTAAMIGLLFVIFAVLLLQIIGVDILQIPGFGK